MSIRRLARVLALAAIVCPIPLGAQESDAEWLARCREESGWNDRDEERFCEVREERIAAVPSLTVRPEFNGGAAVYGRSDRSREIAVSARIRAVAPTSEEARRIAGQVRIVSSGGTITTEGPDQRRGRHWSVNLRIDAPPSTDISVQTSNGPIHVAGMTGRTELRASNGPISIRDMGGDVRARAQNGPISVRLSGDRWNGAGLDAETANGPISLYIPEDFSAELETGTRNGPLDIAFPLTVTLQGRNSGRYFTTRLGGGGAPIRAVTVNGPLSIQRR